MFRNGYYWIHLYGYWRIARYTEAQPDRPEMWEVFARERLPYVLTDLTGGIAGATVGDRIEPPAGSTSGAPWL